MLPSNITLIFMDEEQLLQENITFFIYGLNKVQILLRSQRVDGFYFSIRSYHQMY